MTEHSHGFQKGDLVANIANTIQYHVDCCHKDGTLTLRGWWMLNDGVRQPGGCISDYRYPRVNPADVVKTEPAKWKDGESSPIRFRAGMPQSQSIAREIKDYLETRDIRLQAQDGPCRDSHQGCEDALTEVYRIACGRASS